MTGSFTDDLLYGIFVVQLYMNIYIHMTQVRPPPLCPLHPEPVPGQPPARGPAGGRRLRHEPPQGGPGDLHGAVPQGIN